VNGDKKTEGSRQKAEGSNEVPTMLQGHRDLKVYQLAYKLAMEIFNLSQQFPKDERYSL
jgi:hypothetical protein